MPNAHGKFFLNLREIAAIIDFFHLPAAGRRNFSKADLKGPMM